MLRGMRVTRSGVAAGVGRDPAKDASHWRLKEDEKFAAADVRSSIGVSFSSFRLFASGV